MKSIKTIFAPLLLSIVLFSCDDVEELASFTANTTFNKTIAVAIADDPNNVTQTFTQSTVINLADDDEIQENLNAIESLTITSLSYELKNAAGNELSILKSASISFGNTVVAVNELNIVTTDADNIIFQISEVATRNAIATALENNPSLTVTLAGTVENNPINFDVNVVIGLAVKVQPI